MNFRIASAFTLISRFSRQRLFLFSDINRMNAETNEKVMLITEVSFEANRIIKANEKLHERYNHCIALEEKCVEEVNKNVSISLFLHASIQTSQLTCYIQSSPLTYWQILSKFPTTELPNHRILQL